MLVLARTFQGLSAGIVNTVGLTLLVEPVTDDEIGSWIGFALSGIHLVPF